MRLPHLLLAALTTTTAAADDEARTNYLLHCRGCHMPNGTGVPPYVPTLINELGRIVATPKGREYVVRVPGVSQANLSDADLAVVLNWVLTEFNAETLPRDFTPYSASEVAAARAKVLPDPLGYRQALVRD